MAFIPFDGAANNLALSLIGGGAQRPVTFVLPLSTFYGIPSGAGGPSGLVSLSGRWGTVYDGAVDLLLPSAVGATFLTLASAFVGASYATYSTGSGGGLGTNYFGDGYLQTAGIPGSGADMIVSNGFLVSMPLSVPAQFGTVLISMPLRNAILNQYIAATTPISFFHATNAAVATFYSGSAPASADDAATGTVLATTSLLSGDFIAPTVGLINLVATRSLTPVATGTVGYMRIVSANGLTIQCGVGTLSANVLLSSLSLTAGSSVTLKSLSIVIS